MAARLVLEDSALGASIAVNGVCLTVVERGAGRLGFDLGPETLSARRSATWAPAIA